MLVAAGFASEGPYVDLTFDRAVDIAGLWAGAFAVSDSSTGTQYAGAGAGTVLSAQSVRVDMTPGGPSGGPGVTLFADAANGIVSVDSGEAWAGASWINLPYP